MLRPRADPQPPHPGRHRPNLRPPPRFRPPPSPFRRRIGFGSVAERRRRRREAFIGGYESDAGTSRPAEGAVGGVEESGGRKRPGAGVGVGGRRGDVGDGGPAEGHG